MNLRVASVFASAFLVMTGFAAEAPPQPVYVYLFSRFSDFVNIDLTERRIRETLPLIEQFRQKHPEQGVTATVLVSGALSTALAERNAKTGIKDYILDYVRRGVIEMGYDGTDEPTYQRRPRADLSVARTPEARWLARGEAAERLLTEARDVSGLTRQGKPGGLKAMQEVFGDAVCITGLTWELGSDTEAIHHMRRYNTKAIMWGVPDPDPARNIHGYRGSAEGFANYLSSVPHTSPELNWVDDVLRSSETSDAAIRAVSALEGPEGIRGVLEKIKRDRVRIVHFEIGDVRIYLSDFYRSGVHFPPLRLAYDHPERPDLPVEAFADQKQLAEALARQSAALEWLTGGFLPKNTGSRFVSSSDLRRMSQLKREQPIAVAALEESARNVLKTWGSDTYLPDFVSVGDRQLSLADTFYALTSVLAEQHLTDKRPESVRIGPVYGPLETDDDHGPATGAVTAAAVARVCASLKPRLDDRSWKPMPANMVPSSLEVDGLRVNAAQFLRLMMESLIAPSPAAHINVKMTNMFSAAGLVYPKMRPSSEQGATWTFRPALLGMDGR